MDVRLPNGMVVRGVPDNITKAQLLEKLKANGYDEESLLTPAAAPKEESGFFRQALDIPVQAATGFATGIRLITDAFGADNPVSQNIRGVEDYLQGLLSAQAKDDQQEIARIMKEAEDKGVVENVVAGLEAFATAPVDFLSQAAGTAIPTLMGGLAAQALKAPALLATTGIGAVMGAGTTKSSIYDATYQTLREQGASEADARKRAELAQEYGGENLDQILLGTVLGGAAGRFGIEPALAKNMAGEITKRSLARGAAMEAAPEFAQAAQEQVAANVALQRQGMDVPTFRGAVGAGTLEALAGAGLGAGAELIGRAPPPQTDLTVPGGEETPPAPPEPPAAAPSRVVEAAPEWLKDELASSSPDELAARIPDIESRLGKYEALLADEPRLVDLAEKRGTDPEEAKQKTLEAVEQNRARLDFYNQRIQELTTPAAPAAPAPEAKIDQPLAKELGVVDVVTGETPITVSAPVSEVPSAAPEVSPGVVEPIEPQPVGGGVDVSPQRPEPEGRGVEVAPSEGLGVAPRALTDVVQGEAGVEPALEAAPPVEPAPPAEPSVPEVPTLREDATDAEVKAYYEAMQARDAALGIKPTPSLRRKKKDQALQRGEVPPTPQITPEEAQSVVSEATKGWRNAPEIVVANADDPSIPDAVRQSLTSDTKGTYANGTVYVLADRAKDKSSVRGTVFHESLGHFGLRDTFGSRLDSILDDIYKSNAEAKTAADELIAKYPDLTPARAVEEALAIRSEAGPIKEAGLRAAFNRVAAFIRRAVRTMGIPLSYSNNDIAQVLAQAHRRVAAPPPKGGPVVKSKGARGLVDIPGRMVKNLRTLSPEQAAGFRAAMSQLGDAGRDFAYGMMSLPELVDAFKKTVPTLQGLLDVINERAFELKQRRVKIEDNINKWTAALNKHQGQLDKFYSVALESTRLQIDFRSKDDADKSLTKEFYSLPKDLQDVYFELLAAYRKAGNEYIELVVKNLPATVANQLRAEFESQRLKIYLPLFRDGDYWLRYQDKDNETVVRAFSSKRERELAWADALREGAKSGSRQNYQKVNDVMADRTASSGFYSNVVKELDTYYAGNTPLPIKQAVYEIFLDSIPATSIRQQFRKREGYQGAERDLLKVYATVGSRMANQLNNLKFGPRIEEANKLVTEDINKALAEGDSSAAGLQKNIEGQLEFLRDPTNPKWVNFGVFVSYFDFIVGNISSAVANLTQLPMTVYPLLAGEYGLENAQKAMTYATRLWFGGGWDSQADERQVPKQFPADRTMFTPENIPANSPLGRLFDRAFRENVIKHSVGYDLIEARERRVGLGNYVGMKNKVVQTLGWAFQNTERFNREVTLVAGFQLAMEKGKAQGKSGRELENYAIKRAIRLTNETHGVALTEAGPRFFQKGALKIALTFKNFARTQYYLQYRLLKDALKGMDIDTTGMSPEQKAEAEAENREFRKMATKQWLGVLGGAFTFAGIQGLPFYGAFVVLASLANAIPGVGDDDDLLDMDEEIKQAVGILAYKGPVNQIFGADVASRTGFNGMFWRDDPKRVAEIGAVLYTLEQLMGPLYGSVKSRVDAYEDFKNGYTDRALEKSMPVFIRNMLKTYRYNQEGIRTKDKDTKIAEDPTAYEEFMQATGFTPARISESTARAGARAEAVKKFEARRKALLDRAYLAYVEQDYDEWVEALDAIAKHNQSKAATELNTFISFDTLERSFRERTRRSEQAVDGLYFAPRMRPGTERLIQE